MEDKQAENGGSGFHTGQVRRYRLLETGGCYSFVKARSKFMHFHGVSVVHNLLLEAAFLFYFLLLNRGEKVTENLNPKAEAEMGSARAPRAVFRSHAENRERSRKSSDFH
jgi:hypothetical protein